MAQIRLFWSLSCSYSMDITDFWLRCSIMLLLIYLLDILLDCDGVRMVCHVSNVVQLGVRGQRLLLRPESLPWNLPCRQNVNVFSHCALFILLLGGRGRDLIVFLLSKYFVQHYIILDRLVIIKMNLT